MEMKKYFALMLCVALIVTTFGTSMVFADSAESGEGNGAVQTPIENGNPQNGNNGQGQGNGNGNGNGNSNNGQQGTTVHGVGNAIGNSNDKITVTVGDKTYTGKVNGDKISIDMNSKDNIWEAGTVITVTNNETNKVSEVIIGAQEGNDKENGGKDQDKGHNNYTGTIKGEEKDPPKVEEKDPPKEEEKEPPEVDKKDPPEVDKKDPPEVEEITPPKEEEKEPPKVEEKEPPKVEEKDPPKVEEITPPPTVIIPPLVIEPINPPEEPALPDEEQKPLPPDEGIIEEPVKPETPAVEPAPLPDDEGIIDEAVEKTANPDQPKTGDTENLVGWMSLMLAAVAALGVTINTRKKTK